MNREFLKKIFFQSLTAFLSLAKARDRDRKSVV